MRFLPIAAGFVGSAVLAGCLTIENNTTAPVPAPGPGVTAADAGLDAEFSPPSPDDAGTTADANEQVDAGHVDGDYFASCMTELANGQVSKTFSFWVHVKLTPERSLSLTFEALQVYGGTPPRNVSRAGIVGSPFEYVTQTDVDGSFVTPDHAGLSFPGSANPISGTDVVISPVRFAGRFSSSAFCARMTGHVILPSPAERDLDENKNVCLFTPTSEGALAPTRVFADYDSSKCPL